MRAIITVHLFALLYVSCSCDPLINQLMDSFRNLEHVSTPCRGVSTAFRANLRNPGIEGWALTMIDASSKIPSGIMAYNLGELGNFDQCIYSTTAKMKDDQSEITGKYCLGDILFDRDDLKNYVAHFKDPSKAEDMFLNKSAIINNLGSIRGNLRISAPTWAACFPSNCTTNDITYIVNSILTKIIASHHPIKSKIVFREMYCQTRYDIEQRKFSPGAIITLILLSIWILFLIGLTTYEYFHKTFDLVLPGWVKGFSLISNIKILLTINEVTDDHFPCLDGLKFFSMLWVILGHQYSISINGAIVNPSDLYWWTKSFWSMFVENATLSVDTFLVIGGFLAVTVFLRNQKHFSGIAYWPVYIVHRYIRLTPSLAILVLISSTLINLWGTGPRWPAVEPYFQDNCINYWWSTLLYIQNWVNVDHMCVGQTWYLSIDFQLYVISPLLFTALYKFPRYTLALIGLSIGGCMYASFQVAWRHELTALLSNIHGNALKFNNKYYLQTYTRAAPWLIGTVLGYLTYRLKSTKFSPKLHVAYWLVGWVLCGAIMLCCILVGHGQLKEHEYLRWGNSLHIALVRPFWALTISYIIFTLTFEKASILSKMINSILSFPPFQVLSRFTYAMYLVHVTMMYLMTFSQKAPFYFSNLDMLHKFFGSVAFTMALSLIWILLFESPFIQLEKLFLAKLMPKQVTPTTEASAGSRSSRDTTSSSLAGNPLCPTVAAQGLSSPIAAVDVHQETGIAMKDMPSTSRTVATVDIHTEPESPFEPLPCPSTRSPPASPTATIEIHEQPRIVLQRLPSTTLLSPPASPSRPTEVLKGPSPLLTPGTSPTKTTAEDIPSTSKISPSRPVAAKTPKVSPSAKSAKDGNDEEMKLLDDTTGEASEMEEEESKTETKL